MQHNNNIIKLLGFQDLDKKFKVNDISFNVEKQISYIEMYTSKVKHICPHCKSEQIHNIKDYHSKILKHGDIVGKNINIKLKYIRYECRECGKTFYEDLSSIHEKYCRHTNAKINNILNNLPNLTQSVKKIANTYNIDHRLVNRLFALKVYEKNLSDITTLPENIGIDEFKGNMLIKVNDTKIRAKYQIQISDLDKRKVIALIAIKDSEELEKFFNKIVNRKDVKNVVMDMSMQYKRQIKRAFRNAKITVDHFHVVKLVTKAVDDLRLELWRKYTQEKTKEGLEKRKYLKSLKNMLLTDYKACTNEKYKKKIDNKLNKVFEFFPELKKAYDKLQSFYDIKRSENRENAFLNWFNTLEKTGTFKTTKKTIYSWYSYIKNMYITGLSNAITEGKNNNIKVLKRVSYGFGNFENARNRILVCA